MYTNYLQAWELFVQGKIEHKQPENTAKNMR